MKIRIRQRDRRALVALAVAAGIYLLVSMVALPLIERLKGASAVAAEKEEQLTKYRRASLRKGHYAQLLERARKNMSESESRLIRGDNPSLASVELQGFVEAAAKRVNISFEQRSISTAKKADEFFNEITMSLSFQCSPNQLTMFLADLRNSPKFVTVRTAQVAPVEMFDAAPKKGEVKKTIRVNLTVAALLASPAAVMSGPAKEKKG